HPLPSSYFSLHDPAPTVTYPLSLHDALPILAPIGTCRGSGWSHSACRCSALRSGLDVRGRERLGGHCDHRGRHPRCDAHPGPAEDRKSTRLNSSHVSISYAVFCLKKKNQTTT